MPDPTETKSERMSLALTPTEASALEFIQQLHGDKYDGTSSVLRDYSLSEAVRVHQRALTAASRR